MIWTVQNSQQLQAIGEIELGSDRVIGIVAGALVEQLLCAVEFERLSDRQLSAASNAGA